MYVKKLLEWNNIPYYSRLIESIPRLVPEQVPAQTDDSVPCCVQTNVAFECGPIWLAFCLSAASSRAIALVAALTTRELSSACGPAMTRGPGIRGRHNCLLKKLITRAASFEISLYMCTTSSVSVKKKKKKQLGGV